MPGKEENDTLEKSLKELNLTSDEMTKFEKAFKDPEFIKLFEEYAKEVSDPKVKAETDAYLRQIEQQGRAEDVYGAGTQLIVPDPAGAVIKTKVVSSSASKKQQQEQEKQEKEYRLSVQLPYGVDDAKGRAKFDKARKRGKMQGEDEPGYLVAVGPQTPAATADAWDAAGGSSIDQQYQAVEGDTHTTTTAAARPLAPWATACRTTAAVETDTPGGYHVAARVLHPADSRDPQEFVVAATHVSASPPK
eukprot:XP_001696794.1 predicted protein [Chlamydomonas reinhardtii]